MFDVGSITQVSSVEEALRALEKDPAAILIAGGSDVLIQVREGKLAGRNLISIHGIAALQGVAQNAEGALLIGPLTTFAGVTESALIQRHVPALGFATDQAGGPQLRQVGTIGGNVCNGVTSADSAPALLTLNAQLEITGPGSIRYLPLEAFYRGPGQVDLAHTEMLTAIRIEKKDYEGFYGHYIKFAQRAAMDIATLGCAVHVRLGTEGRSVDELRLAFGVAAPTPIRCHAAEDAARGMALGPALFSAVSEAALGEVRPRSSWRASKEFRQQLVRQLSRRALWAALKKAGTDESLLGGEAG